MFGWNYLATREKPEVGQILKINENLMIQVLKISDSLFTHIDGPLYYRLEVKKVL